METVNVSQKEALDFVCGVRNGTVKDLQEKIGEKMVEEFSFVGFLKRGMDQSATDTWHVLEYAEQFRDSVYGKPNFMEKVAGYIISIFV